MIVFHTTWYHILFQSALAWWVGRGAFHFAVLLFLSSRYYSSCVLTRTTSLGPVELLSFVLPLYSFVLLCTPPPLPPPFPPPPPSIWFICNVCPYLWSADCKLFVDFPWEKFVILLFFIKNCATDPLFMYFLFL